jgi:hypothetical protein
VAIVLVSIPGMTLVAADGKGESLLQKPIPIPVIHLHL